MDVHQVLKNTLAPDLNVRTGAENQLNQASETDFPGYLRILAQELASEDAEQQVRMAAGLALKNAFSAREYVRLKELQNRWLSQIDPEAKATIKNLSLRVLSSNNARAGNAAAQFIASIAAIELPRDQWPDLMPTLVSNVSEGQSHQKQASLATIGYICEMQDIELQNSLAQHSNTILTAVVQGARKEEPNEDVRFSAITALSDSLEFVRSNFENEGERNYIMQVVCEATQAQDNRIVAGAYGCLNRIMALYYDKMSFYMHKALFGLTIRGMQSEEDEVSKLAIEFWCTVCEEEISIDDDNTQAQAEGIPGRQHFTFAQIATQEVIPVLLQILTQVDEDDMDESFSPHMNAYQCLCLWAQAVGNPVVHPVLQFVEANIRSEDWHFRDAAVSALGAIMEGPDTGMLDNIVKQALPILITMMTDSNIRVKDSVAYTLGRASENVSEAIDAAEHLPPLVRALFDGLASTPRISSSCCWALMNLANCFAGEPGCQENPMTPFFDDSVSVLVRTTERLDTDSAVRVAAYEVLNTFIINAANSSVATVARLSEVILQRTEESIQLRQQVLSVDDRLKLDEMQTSLCTVISTIVQRLGLEIQPQADRIMRVQLEMLNTLGPKSSVADSVFGAIGNLAQALDDGFQKYMEAFAPYLFKALNNREEPALCSMAIGVSADITRSLGHGMQPYCNELMNSLLENLRSTSLGNQFKPAILEAFGDVAGAIGGDFEMYLGVVAQVLDQATSINIDASLSYEILDYIVSLREGIMDAWAGVIQAMKASEKGDRLREFVESIFKLLHTVFQDQNRSEALQRASMGVIGDLAGLFPQGSLSQQFQADWLQALIKETRSNKDFSANTIQTARYAKAQVNAHQGGATSAGSSSAFQMA